MNMRKSVATVLLGASLCLGANQALAAMQEPPPVDDYEDSESHPFRVAAYALYPVGFTLEWLVFRPLHRLVSQPGLAAVFGHSDHSEDSRVDQD